MSYSRTFYWHYPLDKPHFLEEGLQVQFVEGDLKLIEYYDTGEKEFYDLKNDIAEIQNLADRYPNKVKDHQYRLDEWKGEVVSNNTSHQ